MYRAFIFETIITLYMLLHLFHKLMLFTIKRSHRQKFQYFRIGLTSVKIMQRVNLRSWIVFNKNGSSFIR